MHSRSRPIKLLPVKSIRADADFQIDEYFMRLVTAEARGKLKVSLTRLPAGTMTSGFFKRHEGRNIHVTNLKQNAVEVLKRSIRGGSRPSVEVYWSSLAPDGGGYVCPDTENTLGAYRALGLTMVPSRIMGPKSYKGSEGAIWIEERAGKVALAKALEPKSADSLPALAGSKVTDISAIIQTCTVASQATRKLILNFHEDAGGGLHFHQMCFAMLRRHERFLDSIGRLVSLGRLEHAGALSRLAYEAFLNFYIDWLSPEFFGPRLQLLAAVRMSRPENSAELLAPLTNMVGLLENAADKAKLTPLGTRFHQALYPSLSSVVHQSYAYVEREATEFLDEDVPDLEDSTEALGQWLNLLSAAFVVRIENEVGAGSAPCSLTPS